MEASGTQQKKRSVDAAELELQQHVLAKVKDLRQGIRDDMETDEEPGDELTKHLKKQIKFTMRAASGADAGKQLVEQGCFDAAGFAVDGTDFFRPKQDGTSSTLGRLFSAVQEATSECADTRPGKPKIEDLYDLVVTQDKRQLETLLRFQAVQAACMGGLKHSLALLRSEVSVLKPILAEQQATALSRAHKVEDGLSQGDAAELSTMLIAWSRDAAPELVKRGYSFLTAVRGKQKKVRDEWNQPIDVVDIFDETVTPDIVDSGVESFKALERIPVPGNMQGHGKNWRTVLVSLVETQVKKWTAELVHVLETYMEGEGTSESEEEEEEEEGNQQDPSGTTTPSPSPPSHADLLKSVLSQGRVQTAAEMGLVNRITMEFLNKVLKHTDELVKKGTETTCDVLTRYGTGANLSATVIYVGMVKCMGFFKTSNVINVKRDKTHAALLYTIAEELSTAVGNPAMEDVPGFTDTSEWEVRCDFIANTRHVFDGTEELLFVKDMLAEARDGADQTRTSQGHANSDEDTTRQQISALAQEEDDNF